MSDRILVRHEGRLPGTHERAEADQVGVMDLAGAPIRHVLGETNRCPT